MSTKNLARTVIEGGRYRGITWYSRRQNRAPRAIVRSTLTNFDPADAETDEAIVPRAPKVGRHFSDKLSPAAHGQARPPLPRPERELVAWLSGRRVGACGNCLFWFIPTVRGGYHRRRLLERADARLWRSLPAWFRACHDPFAATKATNPDQTS
ncbi:MAG TPA: hypothetical protein VKQ32_24315 [Polyangia bacterium]|nr:hypothetical protein [Polyangia bacterium]